MIKWKFIMSCPRHDPDEEAPNYLFYDKNIDFIFQGWMDESGEVWADGSPYDSSNGWSPTHWAYLNKPEPL